MRNDFLDHFCEPGYRTKNRSANPSVKSFRTNKPKVRDLIQNDEGEYEIFDERNSRKFSKVAKISKGENHWNDQKNTTNRFRMIKTFLQSRIGHFWNDIYSEVCFATRKGDPYLSGKLRRNLVDEVFVNTFFGEDGELYNDSAYSYRGPDNIKYRKFHGFYVHPETNKLHSVTQDFNETIPRTREHNRNLHSRRMTQKKVRKQINNKRKKNLSFGYPRYATFEEEMQILSYHNSKINSKNV